MKTVQMPYPSLSKALGLPHDLYLKREDTHKYGSHKGRSIPIMIKHYTKNDETIRSFVLSSSGNAALAAIHTISQHNKNNNECPLTLDIYIGKRMNPKKKETLIQISQDSHIHIHQVEQPKQAAILASKHTGTVNLRQSTDDLALEGYQELAQELSNIPNLSAVFIPTSSGTTAQALGQAFQSMGMHIQIHIVQTTSCYPIAVAFDMPEILELSIANAIVDQVAHRKEKVISLINESHGHGWIVTNPQIKAAQQIVKQETTIDISPNSALSVAGLQKAIARGWTWPGPVVCLITGL